MQSTLPSLTDRRTEGLHRRASVALVAALAGIYLTEWLIARHGSASPDVDLLAWAITADLVFLVPLLVYGLGIRRLGWSKLTLMPALAVGWITASFLAPAARDGLLADLKILAAPLELLIVGAIAWQAHRAWRRLKAATGTPTAGLDLRQALGDAARQLLGHGRVAEIVASEMVMFAYACSWRRPPSEAAAGRFTLHRHSGFGLLMGGATIATVAEIVPVHFLVHHFVSPLAAWGLTLLSVYGAVWILGHWQAVRQRPVELGDDALMLRLGLLWDVKIPYRSIANLRAVPPSEGSIPGALRCVPAGLPSHAIELTETLTAEGPYGLTRQVDLVALYVDEAQRFERQLERRMRPMEQLDVTTP